MTPLPRLLVGTHILQREILHVQQPHLLEIGRGNAPSALEVTVEPVTEHIAQGTFCLPARLELDVWIAGVLLQWQSQCVENLLREGVVGQPHGSVAHSAIESAAQHTNLDKVVEMASLQRGILPIVGETEQLACSWCEGRISAQVAHGREAKHGRSRAAALGAERRELGKVTT